MGWRVEEISWHCVWLHVIIDRSSCFDTISDENTIADENLVNLMMAFDIDLQLNI